MTGKIHFDLVSPERLLISENAERVTVPGAEGYFGAMAGHMPLISSLRPGFIEVQGGDQTAADGKYFIRGGFAEVNAEQITVLAEEAIPMSDFDLAALDHRIKDTEEDLIAAKGDDERRKVAETLDDLKLLRAVF